MSANPQPRSFVTGDLDLLISRSLDGDLPGEEERDLQSLLVADPSARARYEAMARVVGRLEELPDPEPPFAMSIRVNAQLEDDTKGFAASLHKFGFYFRPATIGVIAAGIAAVTISYSVVPPPKPAATIAAASEQSKAQPAAAPEDDGRVNAYFAEPERKKDGPAPARESAAAAPAAPAPSAARARSAAPLADALAEGRADDEKRLNRQQPTLGASSEASLAKNEDLAFAPEPDTASRAAAAPAPQAAGGLRAVASAQVVGPSTGTLRLAAPARLDGLPGPFEGSYRLDLDGTGRVTSVVRLVGGSGSEPSGLSERLKDLSFTPAEAARTAGTVDVKVRLP